MGSGLSSKKGSQAEMGNAWVPSHCANHASGCLLEGRMKQAVTLKNDLPIFAVNHPVPSGRHLIRHLSGV